MAWRAVLRHYDYLIRQVAALDATHRGRTDLASYYTERGETPGRWVGRGSGAEGVLHDAALAEHAQVARERVGVRLHETAFHRRRALSDPTCW